MRRVRFFSLAFCLTTTETKPFYPSKRYSFRTSSRTLATLSKHSRHSITQHPRYSTLLISELSPSHPLPPARPSLHYKSIMATRAHPHPITTNMSSTKQPYLPSTEAQLRCANKRRLFRAFKQADTRFTADWLLNHPSHTFHHRPPIPSTAFDHAIGIRATQSTAPPSTGPGTDLLLVPVALHQGRLLGYSFGGVLHPPSGQTCPYGGHSRPLFPHYVGRFSYDIASGDFLAFIHGISRNVTGVINLRCDSENRERSMFVVAAGDYGFQRLPGKLLSLITGSEKRRTSTPKYQFTVGGVTRGGSTDDRAMNDALARMERLLKGDFYCPKMRRDDMDPSSGEVLCRVTISADSHFDVMDGVSQQRSKEQAMRTYYSYMSSVSGGGSSS